MIMWLLDPSIRQFVPKASSNSRSNFWEPGNDKMGRPLPIFVPTPGLSEIPILPPTTGDKFLHIGTDNTSTLLGSDNTTHANHLAAAFVIKGFRRFE